MNGHKDLDIKDAINKNCPWSGKPIEEKSLTTYNGQVVGFCNTGCRDKFNKAVDLFDDLMIAP
ncbi:MAG: glutathione S-transferase [Marinovum sp.]|nr:glutathione S-transferase [Marinovum sp.]|tara:strand:- start:344 stop:532 length:189 start_codon:yes stop_codon:yes gene_type:complete